MDWAILSANDQSVFEGDRTIHLKTIHLTLFYLETGYCHGGERVRVWVAYGWCHDELKKSSEVKCRVLGAYCFLYMV